MSFLLRTVPLLLTVLGASAIAQAPSSAPATPAGGPPLPWAVVSIHLSDPDKNGWSSGDQPDGINMTGIDLTGLISTAYSFGGMPMRKEEMSGLPEWARHTRYDIVARVDPDDVPAFKKFSDLSLQQSIAAISARQYTGEDLMVQNLLADRFKFKMHWESRDRNVYTLTLAKGGSKLKPAANPKNGSMNFSQGHITGAGMPAFLIANLLSQPLDRIVVDKTGLTGTYDFDLKFQPPEKTSDPDNSAPDIFTAVQEQLGLKLQSEHASLPSLVVDHIEPPTPN